MNIIEDPCTDPRVLDLIDMHLAQMRAWSPPDTGHAIGAAALKAPSVILFSGWQGETLCAIGALSELGHVHGKGQGELKSMHVRASHRGQGLGQRLLAHIEDAARARTFTRLSLETGSFEAFAPTRAFYAAQGYTPCPPFGAYTLDPLSTYMTKALTSP